MTNLLEKINILRIGRKWRFQQKVSLFFKVFFCLITQQEIYKVVPTSTHKLNLGEGADVTSSVLESRHEARDYVGQQFMECADYSISVKKDFSAMAIMIRCID